MVYNKTQEEFEQELLSKMNGNKFIRKQWAEYKDAIFYYQETDDSHTYEIGIYRQDGSYEIYYLQ